MNMHYIEWICRRVNEYALNWMNMHSTDWLYVLTGKKIEYYIIEGIRGAAGVEKMVGSK